MSKVNLRLFSEFCPPYRYLWELTNKRIYVAAYHDGYSTKSNAKRAAFQCAKQLGLEITGTEDNT